VEKNLSQKIQSVARNKDVSSGVLVNQWLEQSVNVESSHHGVAVAAKMVRAMRKDSTRARRLIEMCRL